jgi:hypothetical protein
MSKRNLPKRSKVLEMHLNEYFAGRPTLPMGRAIMVRHQLKYVRPNPKNKKFADPLTHQQYLASGKMFKQTMDLLENLPKKSTRRMRRSKTYAPSQLRKKISRSRSWSRSPPRSRSSSGPLGVSQALKNLNLY